MRLQSWSVQLHTPRRIQARADCSLTPSTIVSNVAILSITEKFDIRLEATLPAYYEALKAVDAPHQVLYLEQYTASIVMRHLNATTKLGGNRWKPAEQHPASLTPVGLEM